MLELPPRPCDSQPLMRMLEWCAAGFAAVFVVAAGTRGPIAAQSAPVAAGASEQRELLDKYCVTCHNDRVKTANLSLQNADLARVAEQAEMWEKVVRKMRAGVMPPPARNARRRPRASRIRPRSRDSASRY